MLSSSVSSALISHPQMDKAESGACLGAWAKQGVVILSEHLSYCFLINIKKICGFTTSGFLNIPQLVMLAVLADAVPRGAVDVLECSGRMGAHCNAPHCCFLRHF